MRRLIEQIRGFTEHCLYDVLKQQLGLTLFPYGKRHALSRGGTLSLDSNEEAWKKFRAEEAYDTKRVRLEHFHLFEWFPVAPGRFHTEEAKSIRDAATEEIVEKDGQRFFNHFGKRAMINGGVGCVRLKPRRIGEEPHFFMTASSSDVCHEGFPVLIPRRLYGRIKNRILADGAAPVTLSGEMKYIDENQIPKRYAYEQSQQFLYLHVDDVGLVTHARSGISEYKVSAAISFLVNQNKDENSHESCHRPELYVSYATFDPARQTSIEEACRWLSDFYVGLEYGGNIVTDFDEVVPRFPTAPFGLPAIFEGRLTINDVRRLLTAGSSFGESEYAPLFQVFFQSFYSTQVGGDVINVGSISNSRGVAIGRGAKAEDLGKILKD